ncbi:MAG TPA: hypothetical protein VMT32_21560 [Bryobacteraceae bacterium]|nr:hypothetical protein [Bryobacteraceae bacterium]
MEFRLLYKGSLPSNARPTVKHEIRKQFHKQLVQYWKEHPHLKMLMGSGNVFGAQFGDPENAVTKLGKKFNRASHDFIPLVREQEETYCTLDILFLRRDTPGRIITSGGDLDNRLKTLFDALKVPEGTSGLPAAPEPGFNPIFCLLEDDKQITSLHVTTDRLLTPTEEQEQSHVFLVIHVHVYRGTNVAQVTGQPGSL